MNPEAPAAAAPPTGERAILVVDDDPYVRNMIVRLLELNGYRTLACGNGAEALRLLEAEGPRVLAIILDIMMPVMNGHQVLDALRDLGSAPPVLVISGCNDGLRCPLETTVPFLAKPFSLPEFLDHVRRLAGPPPAANPD